MAKMKWLSPWYAENTAPEASEDKVWHHLDQIYLHGKIEESAGFDLIVAEKPDVPLGIYPVTVHANGTSYGCTAHVWTINKEDNTKTCKGLVVLNTDKESREYAHSKFSANAKFI